MCEYSDSVKSIRIDEGITYIGEYSFANFNKLEEVQLPETLNEIGRDAFSMCDRIQEIQLPSELQWIRCGAFRGCLSLKSVNLPESLMEIQSGAFIGCDGLTISGVPGSLAQFYAYARYITFDENQSNVIKGTCGRELGWELNRATGVLKITGYGVMDEFRMCWEDNVDSETAAREGYAPWVPYRDEITHIECLPGVEEIGDYAFESMTKLKKVQLPNSLNSIGIGAFMRCESLPEVAIPERVEVIGSYAFQSCYRMKKVVLGSGTRVIGDCAFNECDSLKNVILPEGLELIMYGAFQNGYFSWTNPEEDVQHEYGLEEITIPSTVTRIDWDVFGGQARLKKVTILGKNVSLDDNAFANCVEIELYGYAGSDVEAYAAKHNIPFHPIME